MPLGGKVVIETRRVVLTEAYVADRVNVQPGVYVLLAISDTGPGMDVDTQLRLFEPFFTTKNATQRRQRPGSLDGLRDRQTERRIHLGLQRTGSRHDVQDLSAGSQRDAYSPDASRCCGAAPAWSGVSAAR